MENWLDSSVILLGIQFQNWMVATFALVLIAALIAIGEKAKK